MGTVKRMVRKGSLLSEMGFIKGGGNINWFPGHMAAATRAIRDRLKLSDFVIEVRDSRIPLSSANTDLQPMLVGKRRVIALNKKDLANSNIMHKWIRYFDSCEQDCLSINAHSKSSVKKIMVGTPISEASVFLPDTKIVLSCIPLTHVKLLDLVEFKLKEVISREPTLLVMVVGAPNVGKSALINSIHQIASIRFPVQEKRKRATVGPLPGVTQDIAGFKIAHRPSIYVLDTPGVLVPSIPDIETGLKLAVAGSVKDSIVGEERIIQYLLALLSIRGTPLHWKNLNEGGTEGLNPDSDDKPDYDLKNLVPTRRRKPSSKSDVHYIEDIVAEVQRALCATLMEFNGDLENEDDLGNLIEQQFEALQKALKVPHKTSEARTIVSKKFLTLFRAGKLGTFILDDVPEPNMPISH